MSKPKIAVLCGGPFAFSSIFRLHLEKYLCGIALASRDFKVVGLIAAECEKTEIPFLEIESGKELQNLDTWLKKLDPDFIFCICFPHRIPAEFLLKKPNRWINFHPGPLPQFRGPMPIFEVIRKQEKTSAISVHFMEEEFDTGPLIFEETVTIAPEETFVTLTMKLTERAALAALNMAQMIEFGSNIPTTIQQAALGSFYRYPENIDITIDWLSMPAEQISALIRASHPWSKGAITKLADEQIRFSAASSYLHQPEIQLTPGSITQVLWDGEVEIACINKQNIRVNGISIELGTIDVNTYAANGIKTGNRFG